MGRKKPKEPETATAIDSISSQPDIFTKLFGDCQDQKDADSIFSDNNPFRRKPQEQEQGHDASVKDVGSRKDVISECLKVRKRDNEVRASLDSISVDKELEAPLKAKKSKKEKLQETNLENPNVDPELEVTAKKSKGENPNLVLEGKGGYDDGMAKKKKMKRKRDELEREYEEKKYGVVKNSENEERSGGNIVGKKRKSLDNLADMMISKEGFDDESKLLRTVFVGNLPLKVKKKTLAKEFSKFGEVESVRVRSVPILDTKKPRKGAILEKKINDAADSVHAYIVFKSEPSAKASLSHNMAMVEGHHIRVDRACPPRKKLKGDNAPLFDHKRTVFVGNLPFDVKDEELYQLFCGLKDLESSIEGVRIIRDPHNNLGKGFAYVLFKTREAVNLVIKKRYLKIRDRELRLYHAKSNSTPSKRGNPYADQAISPAKKRIMDTETVNNKRLNTGGSMSYQGLRASKSGNQKKVASIIKPDRFKLNPQKGEKQRIAKRPAVAAKKAKEKALVEGGGGAFKQAGKKRKSDSWTPRSSSHKSKKMKK